MDQKLFQDFEALAQRRMMVELTGQVAFALLATMQLALRHPAFVQSGRPTLAIAKNFAQRLEEAVSITPRLKMAAAAGWHAQFDVAVSPQKQKDAMTELLAALNESVKLQSHYAKLLNSYDGGTRLVFGSVDDWLARLRETGTIKPLNQDVPPGEGC